MTTEQAIERKRPARQRADQLRDFRCKNLIVVIEEPENPRNIGTIIRNVNALGAEKVYVVDPRHVLSDDWQDLRSEPKLSKLSVSAVKWTFVKRFDSTDECLAHLAKNRFMSVSTSPHVKGKTNKFLHEVDFTEHAKLAVWFGNEARGLSDLAVEHSQMCISIPMFGMIESLNLATSSGIVLYEATKQRREYASKYRLRDHRGERATPLPTVMARDE
ncbi:TrmH family RNA methyltransferase [Qipengyuania sp.]|uniref:TrmH family RNA methyltransferase n=1 Tax=Qipengyuania sp. TaxID=2004515 RepID=UPI003736AEC5